ncbi:carbohydrate porin [Massilia sp. LXY-6]|uniref:carbohydrate porin n=1 Tax=Massilia sp. LXY-6 TaxID=3379823 RepID=UPI003EE03C6E
MFFDDPKRAASWLLLATLASTAGVRAGELPPEETWNAHAQATYVWQAKPSFQAPYSGPASLLPQRETGYSFSATGAFGLRPWAGTELYFDPEVVQGKAFSGLHGLGGMTNGEQQKTSGPNPTLYRARLFLRQTWDLGGEREAVEPDMNQLGGTVASRRVVLTVGNLAVSDIFDNNAYAHDARSQFLNWALLAHGAWDFAADARGYSWGAALEYIDGPWAVRGGRFLVPAESNGLALDKRIFRHYGDQLELERSTSLLGQPGKLRLLVFRDRARMGGFRDALAAANGGVPDVAQVRRERSKVGVGIGAEQALGEDAGLFARASWNDGKSETYAFAEIERSLSAGVTLKGAAWGRAGDTLGLALVRNGLSGAHRDYLAAGGVGAFIGDGRLDYRPESIAEAYYRIPLAAGAELTLDFQHIANPGYNRARGPVDVGSLRLHIHY